MNIGIFLKNPLTNLHQILTDSKFDSYFITNQDLMNNIKKKNITKMCKNKYGNIGGPLLIRNKFNNNINIYHNETKNNNDIIKKIKFESKTPNKNINKDFINKYNNRNNNLMINQVILKKKLNIIKNNLDNHTYKTVKNYFIMNKNYSPLTKAYSVNNKRNINKSKSPIRCHTPNNLKNNIEATPIKINKMNEYNLNYKIFSYNKNGLIKNKHNNFELNNEINQNNNNNPLKKYDRIENYNKEIYQVELDNNNIIHIKTYSSGFYNFNIFNVNNKYKNKLNSIKINNNKLDNNNHKRPKLNRNNSKKNYIKFSTINVGNASTIPNEFNKHHPPNKFEELRYLPNTCDNKDITNYYYYIRSTVQCLLNVEQLKIFFLSIKEEKKYKKIPGKLSKLFLSIIDNLCENKLPLIQYDNNIRLICNIYSTFKNENSIKSLNKFFFETLHKELNKSKNINEHFNYCYGQGTDKNFKNFEKYFQKNFQSIISDIFYFKYQSKIKCFKCNKFMKNIKFEFLLSFPLDEISKSREKNKDYVTFSECLSYYQKTNYQINQCNNCKNNYTICSTENILLVGPKVVIIYLERGSEHKFDIKFDFNEKLNLNNFIEYKNVSYNYQLIGVVSYIQKNQYVAFCRSVKDSKWYKYDGPIAQESSFKEVKNEGIHYLLFYSLIKN